MGSGVKRDLRRQELKKRIAKLAFIFVTVLAAACASGGADSPSTTGSIAPPSARLRDDGLVPGTIGIAVAARGADVVVSDVRADSAAARAGVRAGDRIRRCNGEIVTSARQLERMVLDARPGSVLRLEVGRDAQWREVELPVEEVLTAVRV